MFDLTNLTALLQEHRDTLWWIASLSFLAFVSTLFIVPWLAVRIPADYFATRRRPKLPFAEAHPILRWTGLILKNLLGAILILAGLAMLVLPGQELLTVVIGVMLVDFPGKHLLEGRIIRMPPVLKSVNWLRRKAKVQALQLDDQHR